MASANGHADIVKVLIDAGAVGACAAVLTYVAVWLHLQLPLCHGCRLVMCS